MEEKIDFYPWVYSGNGSSGEYSAKPADKDCEAWLRETGKPDGFASVLNEWQKKDREEDKLNKCVFVSDGIFDYEQWNTQNLRILFILKEAYDKTEKNKDGLYAWDEPDWLMRRLNDGEKNLGVTWRRIYQWTKAISDMYDKKDASFEAVERIGNAKDIFKRIAVINVKKTNGESMSNNRVLKKHAKRHSEELLKQIKMINPTIIVCGYTCWLLDIALGKQGKRIVRKKRNCELWYKTKELTGREVTVIDFWHPACRMEDKTLYEEMKTCLTTCESGVAENKEENYVKE